MSYDHHTKTNFILTNQKMTYIQSRRTKVLLFFFFFGFIFGVLEMEWQSLSYHVM